MILLFFIGTLNCRNGYYYELSITKRNSIETLQHVVQGLATWNSIKMSES